MVLPLAQDPDPEWRVLDTFDWYSPWYQSKHTYEEVFKWFESCGLEDLHVANVPVAVRGTAPRVPKPNRRACRGGGTVCGIAGLVGRQGEIIDAATVREMCDTIVHRGPDDEGIHDAGPVGLGMRRLSIIDLAGGHQPIHNEDKTVWIVFNGEIYNFPELRDDLVRRGHQFYTHSDTEVIVHLYEELGADCVQKLRGMFAIALYDQRRDCSAAGT